MRAVRWIWACALVACAKTQWTAPPVSVGDPEPVREPARPAVASAPLADGAFSIERATMLALQHDTGLSVAVLAPVREGAFERIEQGRFDPEVYAELEAGTETSSEVARSTGERFDVNADDVEATAGVRKSFPTGTDVDVSLERTREVSNRAPTQESVRLGVTVTQALLRDRGRTVNLARVRQARAAANASDFELQGFVQALVADVQVLYWRYVLARREIEIFQRSLEVAQRSLDELAEQVDVGVRPDAALAVARSEVAVRNQSLIDARSRMREQRLRLLRRITPDLAGALDETLEVLADEPVDPAVLDDVAERVALALRDRPELAEARMRLEERRLETIVTRNGVLPRLDLFVTLGKSGYADSFFDAVGELAEDSYDAGIGVAWSRVLNQRAARGRDTVARIEFQEAKRSIANLEQLVRLDVHLAANEVERARRQIAASATTRSLQGETVRAERERFDVGASTGLLVAQAQRDLLEAEIDEARARIAYRIALVRLHAAEGTLLRRCGVVVNAPRAE